MFRPKGTSGSEVYISSSSVFVSSDPFLQQTNIFHISVQHGHFGLNSHGLTDVKHLAVVVNLPLPGHEPHSFHCW